jgi:microsomal prostaglandin-E synthase 2
MTSACDGSLTNSNNSSSSSGSSNSSSSKKRALNLTSVPTVVLYQYKICPYCNRVKAILEYLGIEYTAIEVNPLTKSELSAFTYKKVPIATINGEVITESTIIIDRLISFIEANDKKSEFLVIDSDKWAEWSDRRLAVYLYPNLTSTLKSSYESFGYTVDVAAWNAPWAFITRVASSLAMWAASGKIKSKYDIKDEQKELDVEIQVWLAALGNNKFLHGDNITMPDLLVFGVIKAVDGLSVQDKMFSRFPQLKRWYFDVKAEMR